MCNKSEFWENSFKAKQSMWGFTPAQSAQLALELFKQHSLQDILIPGFGYGRNGKLFYDHGFTVTGIEISATAINIAKAHYGDDMTIYHGNVSDMPFDNKLYDGIFCYALIHLLDEQGRKKLIQDCYQQLNPGGYMVFVALSTNSSTFGQGVKISENNFVSRHGVNLFYYDQKLIDTEFGEYGLVDVAEMIESPQVFWSIICRKTP